MIGRAAIGYPWIFREIRHFIETGTRRADPTIEERVEVARKHLQKSLEWKGPIAGINEMRRHYANYLRGLPNIKEYRNQLVRITEREAIEAILDEIKEKFKGMEIDSGKIVLENYHEHCPIN